MRIAILAAVSGGLLFSTICQAQEYWTFSSEFLEGKTLINVLNISESDWLDYQIATGLSEERFRIISGIDVSRAKNPFEADRAARKKFEERFTRARGTYSEASLESTLLYFEFSPAALEDFDYDNLVFWVCAPGAIRFDSTNQYLWLVPYTADVSACPSISPGFPVWSKIKVSFSDIEDAERFFSEVGDAEGLQISGACLGIEVPMSAHRCTVYDYAIHVEGRTIARSFWSSSNEWVWELVGN